MNLREQSFALFESLVVGDKRNPKHPASKVINLSRTDQHYSDSRTEAMFDGFVLALAAVTHGLISIQE
jgi:hypothetical protein